jgi:hypothetical protein
MRNALMLAYASDAGKCVELATIDVSNAKVLGVSLLLEWLAERSAHERLTFVVDQHNELDQPSDAPGTVAAVLSDPSRKRWREFFAEQTQHHYVVKGASPNAINAVFAHQMDHRTGLAVYMYEGLNQVSLFARSR